MLHLGHNTDGQSGNLLLHLLKTGLAIIEQTGQIFGFYTGLKDIIDAMLQRSHLGITPMEKKFFKNSDQDSGKNGEKGGNKGGGDPGE